MKPLSPPLTKADIQKNTLTNEQISFYNEKGYLSPIRLFEKDEVQQLCQGMTRMIKDDHPCRHKILQSMKLEEGQSNNTQMIYFQNAWLAEKVFYDTLYNTRMTVPLHQLLGVNQVRFLHDQVFYKPPRHGAVVAWHQDYSYWTRTIPVGHITCFIALDDTNEENGCLHVIPESHQWDLLPTTPLTGKEAVMDAIKDKLTHEQLEIFNPLPIVLKPGEASFHHGLTLHGSYANRSDRPRRSLVLNFMKPDTRSNSNESIMPGTPIIPKGQVVEGDAFPIVIDVQQVKS